MSDGCALFVIVIGFPSCLNTDQMCYLASERMNKHNNYICLRVKMAIIDTQLLPHENVWMIFRHIYEIYYQYRVNTPFFRAWTSEEARKMCSNPKRISVRAVHILRASADVHDQEKVYWHYHCIKWKVKYLLNFIKSI